MLARSACSSIVLAVRGCPRPFAAYDFAQQSRSVSAISAIKKGLHQSARAETGSPSWRKSKNRPENKKGDKHTQRRRERGAGRAEPRKWKIDQIGLPRRHGAASRAEPWWKEDGDDRSAPRRPRRELNRAEPGGDQSDVPQNNFRRRPRRDGSAEPRRAVRGAREPRTLGRASLRETRSAAPRGVRGAEADRDFRGPRRAETDEWSRPAIRRRCGERPSAERRDDRYAAEDGDFYDPPPKRRSFGDSARDARESADRPSARRSSAGPAFRDRDAHDDPPSHRAWTEFVSRDRGADDDPPRSRPSKDFASRDRDTYDRPSRRRASASHGSVDRSDVCGPPLPRDELGPRAERGRVLPISLPYTTPASQFLYGTSVVAEALRSARRKAYVLYLYDGANVHRDAPQRSHIEQLARERRVPVKRLRDVGVMDKMSEARPHNGCILEASPVAKKPVLALARVPRTSRTFSVELADQSAEELAINGDDASVPSADEPHSRYPLVVMLDGVLDVGNLGSIIRTAYFLGADAVALSNHNAPLGPVALKAAAGAAELLPLLHVGTPPHFVELSRQQGWKFYAAAPPPQAAADGNGGGTAGGEGSGRRRHFTTTELDAPLRRHPCVLMLGNEGAGLSQMLERRADYLLSIGGDRGRAGGVDSLNVGVAAGLLCEAFKPSVVGAEEKDLF